MSFKRLTTIMLSLSGLLVAASPAFSATTTGTFTVSATVANNCSVSATNVNFGSVNAGAPATNTSQNITLTCNKGATITSLFLSGANDSGSQKRMTVAGEFLNYHIDIPTGTTLNTCSTVGTNEWSATNGPTGANLMGLFSASGGPKLIPICASIPALQYPTAGSYTDTVTMTLTFN